MELRIDWPGYATLDEGLRAIESLDAEPLMQRWCDILVEGNRRGVLSGVDGNDQPMPDLKYRTGAGKKTKNRRVGAKPAGFGETLHETTGFGPYRSGLHDNLTTEEYQELTGPRLAPRLEQSRVIKNLHTEIRHEPGTTTWQAVAAWGDVVSTDGFPFLPVHFDGLKAGRGGGFTMPRYDLRPVRQKDLQFCGNALKAFINELFRTRF